MDQAKFIGLFVFGMFAGILLVNLFTTTMPTSQSLGQYHDNKRKFAETWQPKPGGIPATKVISSVGDPKCLDHGNPEKHGRHGHCPCCGESWKIKNVGPWGDNRVCPKCGSLGRMRFFCTYWNFNKDKIILDNKPAVLHIAPSKSLKPVLQKEAWFYIDGDAGITPGMPGIFQPSCTIDLTDLHFPDEMFDVLIASNVLEHVPDDVKAMSEIMRVLKPGGHAFIPTPHDNIHEGKEGTGSETPEERLRLFGQADHIRVYGKLFVQRLTAAGFDIVLEETIAKWYDANMPMRQKCFSTEEYLGRERSKELYTIVRKPEKGKELPNRWN